MVLTGDTGCKGGAEGAIERSSIGYAPRSREAEEGSLDGRRGDVAHIGASASRPDCDTEVMRQRRSLRPLLAATVILAAPALTVRAQQFREADRSALPLECGEVMGFYVTDLDGDAIPDVVFDMTRQLLAPYPARLGRGR